MRQDQVNEYLRSYKRIGKENDPQMAEHCMRVPLEFYTSGKYAEREREILMTTPLMLAHCDQMRNPYDYLVRQMVGKSILLTRDGEGKTHAFLNTCRHRGHEPAQGCGNKRRFSCPYHSWTYDIRGKLVAMPFPKSYEGVDFSGLGLTELPCEERHGFIWVILTPGLPINVSEHLGVLDSEFQDWGYEDARCVDFSEDVLESNWKSTGEGFLESLHLPTIHANTFSSMRSADLELSHTERRGIHLVKNPLAKDAEELAAMGDPDTVIDVNTPGWQLQFLSFGALAYWIYPNTYLGNHPSNGGMSFTSYQPGPTPDSSIVRIHYLVRGEIADDPANAELLEKMKPIVIKAIIEEDGPALSSCGRGIRTGVEDVIIGRNELGVQMMMQTMADATDCQLSSL